MRVKVWALHVDDRRGGYTNLYPTEDAVTEHLRLGYGTDDAQELADDDVTAGWGLYVIDTTEGFEVL